MLLFCDADTHYPPHYLQLARLLFETKGPDAAAVIASGLGASPESLAGRFARRKTALVGKLLARQCHTGGFGQIFRTSALIAAGGYNFGLWPYVPEDHEVIHRILKQGKCICHRDLWCVPSQRRKDRTSVSWTLAEQIAYHLPPCAAKDWFFYYFLGPRLAKRGLMNVRLRHQPRTPADPAMRKGASPERFSAPSPGA